MIQCGIGQVGIPSADNPYVSTYSTQSLYRVGISQIGGYSFPLCTNALVVTGSIRGYKMGYYSLKAYVVFGLMKLCKIQAIIYHANIFNGILVKGVLTELHQQCMRIVGVVKAQRFMFIHIHGIKKKAASRGYTVESILHGQKASMHKVSGTIRAKASAVIKMVGDLRGAKKAYHTLAGYIVNPAKNSIKVQGIIPLKFVHFTGVKGVIRLRTKLFNKITGRIRNNNAGYGLIMKGTISVATNVATIARRITRYVTDREWL